jgi:hypothetical protein
MKTALILLAWLVVAIPCALFAGRWLAWGGRGDYFAPGG